MAYRKPEDVMLYFRGVADEDNDDGNTGAATQLSSLLIPAKRLRYMNPTSDTELTLFFDSVKNTEGADDQADEITVSDTVVLTVNTNAHKEAMSGIVQAINASKTGLVVVADTVTTNVAGSTVATTFVHPDITGMGGYTSDTNFTGIAVAAVHTGS
jgi:hypothetical protein|tara:strand:- start:1476 stop:1943 length:468 start_codon:yes stop_codon:yes gene_type:complete